MATHKDIEGIELTTVRELTWAESLVAAPQSIAVGNTVTLFNQTLTKEARLFGFVISGATDAEVTLSIGSDVFPIIPTNAFNPVARYLNPRGIHVNANEQVKIDVKNVGSGTQTFRGIVEMETNSKL